MKKFKKIRKTPGIKQIVDSLQFFFPKLFLHSRLFYDWYHFIEESQWWSDDQIKDYQWKEIKKILEYAYHNIPYYRNVLKKLDASPHDFKNFTDFEQFPFLTKKILGEESEQFIPIGRKKEEFNYYTTGGSTGEPLGFYLDNSMSVIAEAFMSNQWKRVGFYPKDLVVRLRGDKVPGGKLWTYQSSSNSYVFSSFHLTKENIMKMVEKINKIRPVFFHVYPSSLWLFTALMKELNLSLNFHPKAIFSGSEKLFDFQRREFELFYKARVFSWLGMSEQAVLAGECEYSEKYHAFPQYSYIELVDEDDKKISSAGEDGEIVGTNLFNKVIPLIRYKTMDVACYDDKKCQCKRNFPILQSVRGRTQEYLITKSGEKFALGPAIFGIHDRFFSSVKKIQFVQHEVGKVVLRVVMNSDSKKETIEKELFRNFQEKVGRNIDLEIRYVDDIPRTKSGKHSYIIQTLKLN